MRDAEALDARIACMARNLGAHLGGKSSRARENRVDVANAAMLLGGMGPVETPTTEGGKLFAGLYALYAGMVVLVAASILVAPVMHRYMHKFHLESRGRQD